MIQVQRTQVPKALTRNAARWLRELRQARAAKDAIRFKKVQARYGHDDVRDGLDAMFSGKCAYCESDIGVVAAPHIEHFRPKHRYIGLTFTWENLLLSCPRCNDGAHKGTLFPGAKQGGPIIDPTTEDPAAHLEFVYDTSVDMALVKPLTKRGQVVAELFGLNARKKLVQARSKLIRQLLALKPHETSDPRVAAALAEARSAESPYLAWVSRIV